MENMHREVFENLVEKQEKEREYLIGDAHMDALRENEAIDEPKYQELNKLWKLKVDGLFPKENLELKNISQEKIQVLDLKEMLGKPLSVVAVYIGDIYRGTNYIPGFEYYKYVTQNPDKAPESLKDGNFYYFFNNLATVSRNSKDNNITMRNVLSTKWNGHQFEPNPQEKLVWDEYCRAILFEK